MELLNKHVTISNFTDKRIEDQLLNNILYSGTRASTTGNMQLYSIIVNQETRKINELLPFHFNQPVANNT